MKRRTAGLVLALAAAALLAGDRAVSAQHHGGHHGGHHGKHGAQHHAPYAGMQSRAIKALSEQQVADLRNGRGMGLALAAELNGYPGPMHVIELAGRLGLTAEQRTQVEALFAAMKAEAVPLGEQLIAQEQALDRAFADRSISPDALKAALAAIGETQGALRLAHLKYHLATRDLLSAAQVARYAELRGYADAPAPRRHHQRPH